jgi:hypothetical protein
MSAERAIFRLTRQLAEARAEAAAWCFPGVAERLRAAAPALAGLCGGRPVAGSLKLRRNVAMHAAVVPSPDAPLAAWRRAQRGPRLGEAREAGGDVSERPRTSTGDDASGEEQQASRGGGQEQLQPQPADAPEVLAVLMPGGTAQAEQQAPPAAVHAPSYSFSWCGASRWNTWDEVPGLPAQPAGPVLLFESAAVRAEEARAVEDEAQEAEEDVQEPQQAASSEVRSSRDAGEVVGLSKLTKEEIFQARAARKLAASQLRKVRQQKCWDRMSDSERVDKYGAGCLDRGA